MPTDIPAVVVDRLPHYLRALRLMLDDGTEVVSSRELGEALGTTPAQIRKDLSYFGRFGKQGRGYDVSALLSDLTRILGLERSWPVVLVGVGRLGRAIITYPGLTPEGFHVRAAFDADPRIVGSNVDAVPVRPTSEMESYIRSEGIDIAILATPGDVAQDVIDRLVACGIRGILNYAPITPHVPQGITVRTIDPVQALQTMTFYLRDSNGEEEDPPKRKRGRRGNSGGANHPSAFRPLLLRILGMLGEEFAHGGRQAREGMTITALFGSLNTASSSAAHPSSIKAVVVVDDLANTLLIPSGRVNIRIIHRLYCSADYSSESSACWASNLRTAGSSSRGMTTTTLLGSLKEASSSAAHSSSVRLS